MSVSKLKSGSIYELLLSEIDIHKNINTNWYNSICIYFKHSMVNVRPFYNLFIAMVLLCYMAIVKTYLIFVLKVKPGFWNDLIKFLLELQ